MYLFFKINVADCRTGLRSNCCANLYRTHKFFDSV